MIRKVYLDFIKQKAAKGDLKWLSRRLAQYWLIQSSIILGRPLCGPILGTLIVNYKCNYRCRMCDLPMKEKSIAEKPLDIEGLKKIILDFSKLGVSGIGFTGGEPLLNPDIFELLSVTKKAGMISHLNTNGFFLEKDTCQKLIDSGVDSINVSLDGENAQTHDLIRGHEGAFKKAVEGAENLVLMRENKKQVRIKIVAVLNRENILQAPALIKLSERLKTDCVEFIPQQPFSSMANQKNDEQFLKEVAQTVLFLSGEKRKGAKIENSFKHLSTFESSFRGLKSPLPCFAAYNSVTVDCYGRVFPCLPWANWARPVGNVKGININNFWYSKEYNNVRDNIKKCRDCYLNCHAELNLLFKG